MHFLTTPDIAASSRALAGSAPVVHEELLPLERPRSPHIPALDGIRGLAVLLVLYCHTTLIAPTGAIGKAFIASAKLSWSGVDLFFVLSGFLITGILFDSKNSSSFFRTFYARRTVRIFPLYYAFLIFALLIVPNVPLLMHTFAPAPSRFFTFASGSSIFSAFSYPYHQIGYWLYLSNFTQARHPGFPNDIVHVSWTLAIEEQFYLGWPLIVFLFNRKTLMRLCTIGIGFSLLLRTVLVHYHVRDTIVGGYTPCRLDGLLAGAWVALMIRSHAFNETGDWKTRTLEQLRTPAKMVGIASAIAIALIAVGSYATGWRGGIGQSPAYNIVGFTVLAALYGAILVLACTARPGSTTHRVFTGKFFTTFGKYSYAFYLFHWPITIVVRDHFFDPRNSPTNAGLLARQFIFYIIVGVISLVASLLSWNLFEKHFLALKRWFPTSHVAPPMSRIAVR